MSVASAPPLAPDKIAVVIARTRHKMILAELQEAVKRGAGFIELRLDYLAKAVEAKRLTPAKQCPWIATLRRGSDGGRWPGSEAERLTVMKQMIVSGAFEWVDLETDVADQVKRFGSVKRIVSYHNMTETPADLEGIYEKMLKQDADVLKLAVLAKNVDDCRRILAIQKNAPKPTVAFCMGEFGFPTRILGLKLGAPFIYAAFNRERGVAPGLPSLDDFRTTYPVRSINAETRVYGLFGDPVAHSYSPILHNHMLRRLKVNAVYLPFRVPDGQLPTAAKVYDTVPVSGYSVTIPHKEAAAVLAQEVDATVAQTGAANTLLRQPNGGFHAYNTDYSAILDSLHTHLEERARTQKAEDGPVPEVGQMFALVLGAGGVSRSIAHALMKAGTHVTIAARTYDRAVKLAAEVGCKVVDWQARHNVLPCDIVVNGTPVGMHPDTDESPVHHSFLKPGMTVFDTVYTPENTLLVQEARARECHVITGVDMFVRQAARQLELFTGQMPAIDPMRELLRKAMSPVTYALEEEARKSDGEDAPDDDADED
ncbi:MAG: shikimate dehydrogenase [Bacteroidales bacterium]|nr:shikimate dehydrogenase [Bacteroidales bacterium]